MMKPQSVRFQVFCAALIVVATMSAEEASGQNNTSLRHFLAAYRCSVVDRLERIYQAGDPSVHRNRYIVVSVSGHSQSYVQCMFFDDRRKMLCEASSGYYSNKEGEPRTFWLSRDARAALRALGFSTDDVAGNHALEFDVKTPPDFNAIADLILKALHDAYDARAESRLRFNAPFAQRESSGCIPVS